MPLVGGSLLHHHAEAVSVTAFSLPLSSLVLHPRDRARALGPLALIIILFGARLKGTAGAPLPTTVAGWWKRFWLDRDE